jgi:type IV secretory pathway TrbF-like protein
MIELLYAIQLILLGALIFALGMYVGIRTYKMAQSPFVAEVDLTPNSNNTHIEDKDKNPEADGWDYSEYDDYITRLGDDIEGVDE